MQRATIEKAAEARGDSIGEWYAKKRTVGTAERPELQRLMSDVDAGGHRRVYVFRLDRLTRMGIADTLAVVKYWRDQGVELVNLADGFTVPPPGVEGSAARITELILAILGWAAEPVENGSQRRELAAAHGEAWGRPSRLSAERRRIRRRAAAGESVRAIATALKGPKSILGRALPSRCPEIVPSDLGSGRLTGRRGAGLSLLQAFGTTSHTKRKTWVEALSTSEASFGK